MQQDVNQMEGATGKASWLWNGSQFGTQNLLHSANFGNFIAPCLTGIVFGLLCLISPMLAVALCLVIIVFIFALSRPIILCYLVICATILTSGMERGRLFPVLSGNEVSLLGALAITLMIVLSDRNRKVVVTPYFGMAFIVLVGGTVIAPITIYLLRGAQLNLGNSFKMVGLVQYFILFWLFTALPQNEGDRRKIIWWMLGLGLLVAVVGLLQGFGVGIVNRLLTSFYSSSHVGMAAKAGRITSLLGSWNSLGIFIMSIIIICWAVLFDIEHTSGRLLIMGIMALSVLCLIASGSFAGIIGTVLGLFVIQLLSGRGARTMPIFILGFIGVILAALVFYPFLQPLIEKRMGYQYRYGGMVPETLLFRFKVWSEVFIPAIRQYFPWPVYPTVPSTYAWQFEESQYILLLFRTGLAGFIGYLTWIAITVGWLYKSYQRSTGFNKSIASAALAIVLMLAIAGFTNEVFSFSGTIDYLWMMLALIANSTEKI